MSVINSNPKLLQPEEYFEDLLKQGLQSDGRKIDEVRATSLQANLISSANGSALVRHGETVVLATVKSDLVDGRDEVEQPVGGSSDRHSTKRSRISVAVDGQNCEMEKEFDKTRAILQKLVNSGIVFDLNELNVAADGKVFWTLYVDVSCLNCDGAFLDICLLAVTTALCSTKLPVISVVENPDDEGQMTFRAEKNFRPIRTKSALPAVACTYLLLADSSGFNKGPPSRDSETPAKRPPLIIVHDPAGDEMTLFPLDAFSLILGEGDPDQEVLCGLYKWGGVSVDENTLKICIEATRQRRISLLKLISDAIEGQNSETSVKNKVDSEKS